MNDQKIEAEIKAKGLTAPRVTLADIEHAIDHQYFFNALQGVEASMGGPAAVAQKVQAGQQPPHAHLHQVTVCVLILRNGHKVVGVNTGSISPEDFDEELARKLARQNAIDQIWPLMGFLLRQRIHEVSSDFKRPQIPTGAFWDLLQMRDQRKAAAEASTVPDTLVVVGAPAA